MNGISHEEALELLNLENRHDTYELFCRASQVREKNFKNKITACSIINARCGGCTENCAFCAQSKYSSSKFQTYPLISEEEIFKAAETASKHGSLHIGIVTSGRASDEVRDLDIISNAIRRISSELSIKPCASLGILTKESLKKLKDAGMARYHHNLETAESFFNNVCTTRTYKDQLATVKAAKEIGLSVCSGGLFGLGESRAQRVELFETLRELDVDSVPINFYNPIKGTQLEHLRELTPMECLKIIAVARLMLPEKNIRICGGREVNLKDFQSWIFFAGADALMIGGYLVTSGREVSADTAMIRDAGMSF